MADLKKQLKAIKKLLGDGGNLQLSDADALRYQDIIFWKSGDTFTTSK